MDTIRQIIEAIKQASTPKTSSYDTPAEVVRVENRTAWVHIPGGVAETPVNLTIDAKAGDTVQVRVGGGRAWLTGNASAPPTDDTKAKQVADSVGLMSKVVRAVKKTANEAARIAGNTNQYFWHTETGTDTGAHITEIPQEEFLADPESGGGNLLARSNGIAVRDGLTELATFEADGLRVYSKMTRSEIAHLGYGAGIDQGGGQSDAPFFTFGIRDPLKNIGNFSVVAGYQCSATDFSAFAEGVQNTASGYASHAEGGVTTASGHESHAEGYRTEAGGDYSHAEGYRTVASGDYSHASGRQTIAEGESQAVFGQYNEEDAYKYVFIIGNGTSDSARSNAFAVTWDGRVVLGRSPITTVTGSSASLASGSATTVASITLDAGSYILTGVCRFAANTAGHRTLLFSASANSVSAYDIFALERIGASQNSVTYMQIAWPVEIEEDGTRIYLNAIQNSGAALAADNTGIKAVRIG